jgi:hypothetical protein
MQILSRFHRIVYFGFLGSVLTIAGCSSGNTTSCASPGFSEGGPSGALVSPAKGATGVPTSAQTLVFSELTQYAIVLKPTNGSSNVQTTPTALPSQFQSNAPGSGGTVGDYAVSVPALSAGTTYTAGTLSDALAQCAGDEQFFSFGTFTTQ